MQKKKVQRSVMHLLKLPSILELYPWLHQNKHQKSDLAHVILVVELLLTFLQGRSRSHWSTWLIHWRSSDTCIGKCICTTTLHLHRLQKHQINNFSKPQRICKNGFCFTAWRWKRPRISEKLIWGLIYRFPKGVNSTIIYHINVCVPFLCEMAQVQVGEVKLFL